MEDLTLFGFDLSEIINLNEKVVIELLEKKLSADDSICKCRMCIEDMYALSLNNIFPRYFQSSHLETAFKAFDINERLDMEKVEKAVQEAINKVSEKPNH